MTELKNRLIFTAVLLPVLCLAVLFGVMSVRANTVRVRTADVTIEDLPSEFDGTRLLYISDPALCGTHDEKWLNDVATRAYELHPDMLLVCGDICSTTLFEKLNGAAAVTKHTQRHSALTALSAFDMPLGRYYLPGDNDDPAEMTELTGFTRIDTAPVMIEKDGALIALAGFGDDTSRTLSLGAQVSSDKCVIAVTHSPANATAIRISEAKDGGQWADLILCGHTYGGLAQVFGRTLLPLDDKEKQYLSGWYTDGKQPMLVSSGLGTNGVGLRLNTYSEVWLIRLLCPVEDIDVEPEY